MVALDNSPDSLEQLVKEEEFSKEDISLLFSSVLQSDDGIVLLQAPSMEVSWVNKGFSKITGYSYEDAVGSSYNRFMPLSDSQRASLTRSLVKGASDDVSFETRSKQGRPYHAQVNFTPVKQAGELKGVAALVYDVSDKVFDERVVERYDSLVAVARKTVHDMRGALMVDNLLEQASSLVGSNDAEAKELIKYSRTGLSRAHNDLQGLTSFLKGSYSSKPHIEECSIDLLVADTVDLVALESKKYSVPVRKQLSSVYAWTDKSRLQHAVGNILQNAIKFSSQENSGEVVVNTGLEDRVGDSYAVVSVTDSGPGVPEELREEIFTPFNQAIKKQPGVSEGLVESSSGYGLSSAKQAIEDVYGFVEVANNTSGVGSTFRIGVPAYKNK